MLAMKKATANLLYFLAGFCSLILALPAHAYAGPGIALGAIVVAITVVLAFFSSIVLRIIHIIKRMRKKVSSRVPPKTNSEDTRI